MDNKNIKSREISELVNCGYMKKVNRGIYIWKGYESSLSDNALAYGIILEGIIYLYSAASYYEFTTTNSMKYLLHCFWVVGR